MVIRQHKSTLIIEFLNNFTKTHALERTDIEPSELHSYSHMVSTTKLVKYFLFVHLKNLANHFLTTLVLSDRNFCFYSQRYEVKYSGQRWHRNDALLNRLHFNEAVKTFFFPVDNFMLITSSEIEVSKSIVLLNLCEMREADFKFFTRMHFYCERDGNCFIWFCWKFMRSHW